MGVPCVPVAKSDVMWCLLFVGVCLRCECQFEKRVMMRLGLRLIHGLVQARKTGRANVGFNGII